MQVEGASQERSPWSWAAPRHAGAGGQSREGGRGGERGVVSAGLLHPGAEPGGSLKGSGVSGGDQMGAGL